MNNNDWFKTLKEGTSKQIIFFPYAGGMSNAFDSLKSSELFQQDFRIIMLNMPGHDLNRNNLYYDVEELCNKITPMVEDMLTMPTILFGYSMGGTVVYELCNQLNSLKHLEKVVIAAANPPNLITKEKINMEIVEHQLKKNIYDLISKADLKDCQTEIFESMYEYLFPIFYADTHLYYSVSAKNKKIDVKAQIIFGEEDSKVNSITVSHWKKYFKEIDIIKFPGGHMFLNDTDNTKKLSRIIFTQYIGDTVEGL